MKNTTKNNRKYLKKLNKAIKNEQCIARKIALLKFKRAYKRVNLIK